MLQRARVSRLTHRTSYAPARELICLRSRRYATYQRFEGREVLVVLAKASAQRLPETSVLSATQSHSTRDVTACERAIQAWGGAGHHAALSADVSDYSAVQKLVGEVEKQAGGVDLLVNAAGINSNQLLIRESVQNIEQVFRTNIHVTKTFLPLMIRKRSGSIVNIGSVISLYGNAGQTVYSASKAALVGFTKSLAKEVASRNIRVNLVAPGFIETAMTAGLSDAQKQAVMSKIGLSRFGNVEEVADAVLFALSSSYMTGQVLVLDGGLNL